MTILLNVAFALLAGLLMTRIFKKWNLPDVTAFLISGVLIGPFVLGRLGSGSLGLTSYEEVARYDLINEVAMGFIAFSIGSEFRLSSLKKTGKQAFAIGILQALAATLLVDITLFLFHLAWPDLLSVPETITLGAIASATAPAATLMVVRQYKAKGELTDLLLPIVALDDAVGLIVFAISFGIAKVMISGQISVASIIFNPLIEIICSLLLGTLCGWILTQIEKLFHSNTNRLAMTIAFILLTVATTKFSFTAGPVTIGFSSLLTCMMLGTVFCNICPLSEDIMERSDKWSRPLLACFFVMSGAALRLEVFQEGMLILIGAVYILSRSIGKYLGTYFSAKAVKCSDNVVKNLGITLLPQAGVALGMCVSAQSLGEAEGTLIRNIVLFAVLIYELIGPLLTREALKRAGDITEMPVEVRERRQRKLNG
ncbi:MAG: cation:proton antiporter [Lachnospiraceae bacterium]|nr:cation:proton antiporter [Lachnospiraceae bacterium]